MKRLAINTGFLFTVLVSSVSFLFSTFIGTVPRYEITYKTTFNNDTPYENHFVRTISLTNRSDNHIRATDYEAPIVIQLAPYNVQVTSVHIIRRDSSDRVSATYDNIPSINNRITLPYLSLLRGERIDVTITSNRSLQYSVYSGYRIGGVRVMPYKWYNQGIAFWANISVSLLIFLTIILLRVSYMNENNTSNPRIHRLSGSIVNQASVFVDEFKK